MTVRRIETPHGDLVLPCFLPDATRAVVRCVHAAAVARTGIRGVMVNSFHLARRPGAKSLARLGGVHGFMGWEGPVVADSGGFQVLSLIRQKRDHGAVRPKGVLFRDPDSGEKTWLTPETSIGNQFRIGADVLIALDDCPTADAPLEEQRSAVEHTIRWFRTSRATFDRLHTPGGSAGQKLVGVAQGGSDHRLRQDCAKALLDVGADAIGFGGWPIDDQGAVLFEAFQALVEVVPADVPIFALGVGKPEHLTALLTLRPGFVFDCSLPTRDARRNRLLAFTGDWPNCDRTADFYRYVYIADRDHARSLDPIDSTCDCECCSRYSRAYLHHLVKVKDSLAMYLATLHNLRFYSRLVEAYWDE